MPAIDEACQLEETDIISTYISPVNSSLLRLASPSVRCGDRAQVAAPQTKERAAAVGVGRRRRRGDLRELSNSAGPISALHQDQRFFFFFLISPLISRGMYLRQKPVCCSHYMRNRGVVVESNRVCVNVLFRLPVPFVRRQVVPN